MLQAYIIISYNCKIFQVYQFQNKIVPRQNNNQCRNKPVMKQMKDETHSIFKYKKDNAILHLLMSTMMVIGHSPFSLAGS